MARESLGNTSEPPRKERADPSLTGQRLAWILPATASAVLMTTYPFALPIHLQQLLPSPTPDGNRYVDVLVESKWDGILVVDRAGMCVGIYIRRQVEPYPLPFDAAAIEDVRPASLWNRCLASIPVNLWNAAVLTILLASPGVLVLASLLAPPLAVISLLACALSIRIMYLAPEFPFIRLPVAVLCLCQIITGMGFLLRSLR